MKNKLYKSEEYVDSLWTCKIHANSFIIKPAPSSYSFDQDLFIFLYKCRDLHNRTILNYLGEEINTDYLSCIFNKNDKHFIMVLNIRNNIIYCVQKKYMTEIKNDQRTKRSRKRNITNS